MAIGDDFSIASNGNIRYTGTTTNYTVIALHRWLGDLMDDAAAAGNDILDITDATASDRSTDNIITLNTPYNIDDTAAQHLYDGSIVQNGGADIYDGILMFAAVNTPLQILQNGKPAYPNFWDAGINADSAAGISHRFMLKVRTAGADIDGRRLVGQTRAVGFTYSEFKINGTSRGNNVLALTYATDLNNATAEATIRGYTDVSNTQGYRLLDVNNNSVNEPYYSEWNKASRTVNQFFERHKWLHRESTIESSCADSGSHFQVANATVIGQAQSFANGANTQYLTRVRVRLRKVGSPTGNLTAKLYAHSGSLGTTSIPTGAALATSVNLDIATLTTAYIEYEMAFTTQYEMVASTNYCIAFERAAIDGSNYVEIQGLAATGSHAGNRSQLVTTTWTATATDDLYFKVYASPKQYGIPGEVFRGVTHEVVVNTLDDTGATALGVNASLEVTRAAGSFVTDGFVAGEKVRLSGFTNAGNNSDRVINTVVALTMTFTSTTGMVTEAAGTDERVQGLFEAVEAISWTGGTGQLLAINSPTAATKLWMQLLTGVAPTTTQVITGATSLATCAVNVTVTERTVATPSVGASTGSALIGAYGLGLETADLSASDKVTDLDNTLNVPPNNVTFTVGGLVSTEDRVLVGPLGYSFAYDGGVGTFQKGETLTFTSPAGTGYLSALTDNGATGRMQIRLLTGSAPADNSTITGGTSAATGAVNGSVAASEDPRQLKLLTTLSGAAETAVVCTAAIPTDTPSTGTIRIQLNSGIFRRVAYVSYASATFTIASTSFAADNATGGAAEAGNSIFISYIDLIAAAATATFTSVYLADRNLFVRVRDGGGTPIKTFETTGTLGSGGGSTTAIRTSDT